MDISPAQRSIIDSISYPPSDNDLTKVPSRSLTVTSLRFVLVATIQGTKGSRVMLFYGLGRTRQNRRHGRQHSYFHSSTGGPAGHDCSFENEVGYGVILGESARRPGIRCGFREEKSNFPAMRNNTVRIVENLV